MMIKDWFINKNFTIEQIRAMKQGYNVSVNRETEKAFNINIDTDFGTIRNIWIPKSVVLKTDLTVGDKVDHKIFGLGKILNDLNGILEIEFSGKVKRIAKAFFAK